MDDMRCRQIKDGSVVWFDSCGIDKETGKAIRAESFVDKESAVASSLTQRLSIIKNELWYRMKYGLPLFEKVTSKAYMDTVVINQVLEHPNVIRIVTFKSTIVDRKYHCELEILSEYGTVNIEI